MLMTGAAHPAPGARSGAPAAPHATTSASGDGARPALVGRSVELAAITRAITGTSDGDGRMLTIIGEAGIGKSALLASAAEQARAAGMLVLEGRAAEHERDVPFGALVDALDDHVATLHPRRIEALGPELAEILPAAAALSDARAGELAIGTTAAERFRYHRALRALLEQLGRERPVALLLDDLHWADAASVEFVLHLLRRPPRVATLALFALRPLAPAPQLLDAARNAANCEQIALGPLSHQSSLALLESVGDRELKERIVREAGGNPLFLEELARVMRHPGASLPPTLLAAIQLELRALPATSRTLAEGAAVAGDPFDPELAAATAGIAPRDALPLLDGLVAVDLLRASDGRSFRFRHPLVRRAVYDAAPPGWRIAAHERAAAALAARGAAPSARAYHVEQAARPGDEAAIALLAEAAGSTAATAPATAARWYAAAARLLPHDAPARRAELLAPMAMALANAGRLDDARATLLEVLALLPDEPTPTRLGLLAACSTIEQTLGRHVEARQRLLAALADAPSEAEAMLFYELAMAAYHMSDDAEARTWATRALVAAGDEHPALRAGCESMLGVIAVRGGETVDGLERLTRATERMTALEDAAVAARLDASFVLGMSLLLAERPREAREIFVRALRLARQTRQGHMLAPLSIGRTMGLLGVLDLDAAARECEEAEEIARMQGVQYQVHWALWVRAWLHWERSESAACERVAAECAQMAAGLDGNTTLVRTGRANLGALRATQDPEAAIAEMTEAGGPLLERVDQSWASWLLLQLVRAGIAAERHQDAARWADHLAAHASRLGIAGSRARALLARAEVALAAGEPTTALQRAGQAATAAAQVGLRLDEVDALLVTGRALVAAQRREEAVAALQRAAVEAARSGARRMHDAAARELRRLGARVPAEARRTATDPDDDVLELLTPREREIAALVAQGRANKQVAAALFLSEKTIEHHLSRIYAKVGVRSRTELAARLARAAAHGG